MSSLKQSFFGKGDNDKEDSLFEPVLPRTAATVAMADKHTRLGFIRKVYGILTIQILATALICALAMKLTSTDVIGKDGYHVLSFGTFLASSQWFQWLIFGFSLIILLLLFAFGYKYPLNMILLSIW